MKKLVLSFLLIFLMFAATLRILPARAQTPTPQQIQNMIDLGLSFLADPTLRNGNDFWGKPGENCVAKTGLAVLKFELHAISEGRDPMGINTPYEYSTEVCTGLNYILSQAWPVDISSPYPYQIHSVILGWIPHTPEDIPIMGSRLDNPDWVGDHLGARFGGSYETYETGIAMMAIAACTHPGAIDFASLPPFLGMTYKEVLQHAVDYLAWGQVDSGDGRGGWAYVGVNNGGSYLTDNSNAGYAVGGLSYAQASSIISDGGMAPGFLCIIPDFVKSELAIWVDYIQNFYNEKEGPSTGQYSNYGGSGYRLPDQWVNALKTGNLLSEMAFCGDDWGKKAALYFYLETVWNKQDYNGWLGGTGPGSPGAYAPGQTYWPGYYQAMYCIMKGLEAVHVNSLGSITPNCYLDIATTLYNQQSTDNAATGSWPNAAVEANSDGSGNPNTGEIDDDTLGTGSSPSHAILSTEWALLSLENVSLVPGYTSGPSIVHDVAVTGVSPFKTMVGQGRSTGIDVTVLNRGDNDETSNVTVYAVPADGNFDRGVWEGHTSLSLPSGNLTTLTFNLDTAALAYGNYTTSAYVDPVPNETHTTNNYMEALGTLLVTVPGDLDGDFNVTLSDLAILAYAYKSTPSSVNWNPNADIDGNGIVNLADLSTLAMHYGQHYP
jgi:hypothetical protein